MFNVIFKTFWQLIIAAFHKDPAIKRFAAFAGACFLASCLASAGTSWLSQPVYHDMLNNPHPWVSWGFSIFIAWVMLTGLTIVGFWVAEKLKNVSHLIPSQHVGIVFLICLSVGVWDATKNRQGSTKRSYDVFQIQAYSEATQDKVKPFQGEIDKIDSQIDALLNDKVKENGRWVMRWGNQNKIDRLQGQREKYVEQQLAAIDEEKALHADNNQFITQRRSNAEDTLKNLSVFLYLIQILFGIPIGLFLIHWDLADGERDGEYEYTGEAGPGEGKLYSDTGNMGFATSAKTNPELATLKAEIERLKRQLNNGIGTPQNRNGNGETVPKNGQKLPPVDSRFTSTNQPERKQGVYSTRADSNESRTAILSTYKAIQATGTKPTYKAIAKVVNLSERSVGTHIRALRREGVIS